MSADYPALESVARMADCHLLGAGVARFSHELSDWLVSCVAKDVLALLMFNGRYSTCAVVVRSVA